MTLGWDLTRRFGWPRAPPTSHSPRSRPRRAAARGFASCRAPLPGGARSPERANMPSRRVRVHSPSDAVRARYYVPELFDRRPRPSRTTWLGAPRRLRTDAGLVARARARTILRALGDRPRLSRCRLQFNALDLTSDEPWRSWRRRRLIGLDLARPDRGIALGRPGQFAKVEPTAEECLAASTCPSPHHVTPAPAGDPGESSHDPGALASHTLALLDCSRHPGGVALARRRRRCRRSCFRRAGPRAPSALRLGAAVVAARRAGDRRPGPDSIGLAGPRLRASRRRPLRRGDRHRGRLRPLHLDAGGRLPPQETGSRAKEVLRNFIARARTTASGSSSSAGEAYTQCPSPWTQGAGGAPGSGSAKNRR